jgi:hypothetical protein
MSSYKYLGSIVNGDNTIEEEIKTRIIQGNKAYYANQILFKSKLIAKSLKLYFYTTVIRPVVTYGSETWVLKEAMKQKLLIFERKILRRIFGPSKSIDGSWRIKTNEELNKLIKYKSIVNHIKAQRLGWFGHVYRMKNDRLVKRIYNWKPKSTRMRGRPKNRWEDDVMADLRTQKVKNWINCIQDRTKWKDIVEKAKNYKG